MFEGIQLITRYCSIEKPYANAFFEHYKKRGAELIHIITQSHVETEEAIALCKSTGLEATFTTQSLETSPKEALQNFDTKKLDEDLPLTILIDMDEYLNIESSLGNLKNIAMDEMERNNTKYLKILWKMKISDKCRGVQPYANLFVGHTGKQLAKTGRIKKGKDGFHNSHLMVKKEQGVGLKSAEIIHYWSRSHEDTLLKVFFSRMKSFKTSDQKEAVELIKNGKLPNRLKILSFLAVQAKLGGIDCPKFVDELNFDHDLANSMLKNYIDEDTLISCERIYQEFTERLSDYLNRTKTNYHPYPSKLKNLREIGDQISQVME